MDEKIFSSVHLCVQWDNGLPFEHYLFYHFTFSPFFLSFPFSFTILLCKENSDLKNLKMLIWLLKDALLACKRCPLSPLLTPFWKPSLQLLEHKSVTTMFKMLVFSLLLHLFSYYFVTIFYNIGRINFLIEGTDLRWYDIVS